jgi:hypothetical protein
LCACTFYRPRLASSVTLRAYVSLYLIGPVLLFINR